MNTQKCISDADFARLWEDDVTPQEKQALQQHIEICPDCRTRWQQMSAGAQHVETLLFETARKARMKGECSSDDLLAGFIDETLGPEKRYTVEDHLAKCSRCREALAEKFTDAYEKEGDTWWSQYVAHQILGLLVQVPDRIDRFLEDLNVTVALPVQTEAIIKLPMLEPGHSEARCLAAATGEGYFVQTVRQDKPAFEFELVQFGEQVRISVRSLGDDSPYKNCLARLELFEGDLCRCSRIILIDKGEGECVLEPEEARGVRPQHENLAMKLVPIVTLDQLASAGSEAYMPILGKLLRHEEPKIRCATVEVIARICGPQAHSLIKPLADDEDETVRQAVKKALNQFPQP